MKKIILLSCLISIGVFAKIGEVITLEPIVVYAEKPSSTEIILFVNEKEDTLLYCDKGKFFIDRYVSNTVDTKEVDLEFVKSMTFGEKRSKDYTFNKEEFELLLKKC